MIRLMLLASIVAGPAHAAESVRTLQRDEIAAPLQLAAGAHQLFAIDVPAKVAKLDVQLRASPVGKAPASGNAVLSVLAGEAPTTQHAQCRTSAPNASGRCELANPAATRHYIRVDATTALAGASLVVKWTETAPNEAARFERWYRTVSTDGGWVAQGADPRVVERTLRRIESAKGPRAIAAAPDTLTVYGPGHWVHEWRKAGDEALTMARRMGALGHAAAAKTEYLEAIHYYNIASYPHLNEDTHGIAALEASQAAYKEASRYMQGTFKAVTFTHEGLPFEAHLHVPNGAGPFPVLVKSGGSDMVKEILYRGWERELAPRGIALLAIDMPGIGGSRRHLLTPDSDKLHAAAVQQLRQVGASLDPRLDLGRIAVEGASFGGHAAGRFFLARDLGVAGVVSVCGPQDAVFRKPAFVYEKMPRMTTDGVRSRLRLPATASWETLASRLRPFSLGPAGQRLLPATTPRTTPLLAIGTVADPVAPLEDVAMLADAGANADLRVFDVPVHCPNRVAREAIIADWLQALFRAPGV